MLIIRVGLKNFPVRPTRQPQYIRYRQITDDNSHQTPKIKPVNPGAAGFLSALKPKFTGLKTAGFTWVFGYPGCIP